MLKVKKIMPAAKPAVLGHVINAMPQSLAAFDDTMELYRTTYPAIARILYQGNAKLMACTPERTAYSNYDEAASGFLLCDVGAGISEVFVPTGLVVDALACSDVHVCQKMLDVVMAAGALKVRVRPARSALTLLVRRCWCAQASTATTWTWAAAEARTRECW